jgi:type I restriction enzyme S subunit
LNRLIRSENYQHAEKTDTGRDEKIPAHWRLIRLRAILLPTSVNDCADYPLLSITREAGVILRNVDNAEENHNFIPDDLSNYKLLKKGQFGMNKMKAWQGSYGVSAYTGIVSPAYYTFNLCGDIFPEFFHLAIRSDLYISYFASASDGVRVGQWDLSRTRMKEIPLLVPPRAEQLAIADFLRDRTSKIGQAIQIKERQIERFKERKQILIQQAVTRGLDPYAPMCDSGIEWIGEIPAHWRVMANRALFRERVEPGREDLPLLSVSIHSGVSEEENIRGRVKIEDKTKYIRVRPGDIAFNMMRAWQGAIGAVRVDGMVSPAYTIAVPRPCLDARYFEYQYRTPGFIQQMDRYSKGITDFRKRLYWDGFKQLISLVPPIEEQLAIVELIEHAILKQNAAVALLEQQISKLKEYRATLINSAVTGKIKVPGVVEPESRNMEVG